MSEYQKRAPAIDYIEISIEAPRAEEDRLTMLLFEQGASGVEIDDPALIMQHLAAGDWDASVFDGQTLDTSRVRLRALLPDETAGQAAAERIAVDAGRTAGASVQRRIVPPVDWQDQWKAGFAARPIGERLWLRAAWDKTPVPAGREMLTVSPGMAFGTGDHATTAMALAMLDKHLRPGGRMIDLGCGSGILGIAALNLGASRAIGVDSDEVCAEAVREHLRINNIEETRFQFYLGDILSDERLMRRLRAERADLIVANITAGVLIALAGPARLLIVPGGCFICSGILEKYDRATAQALNDVGWEIAARRQEGEWVAYVAMAHE